MTINTNPSDSNPKNNATEFIAQQLTLATENIDTETVTALHRAHNIALSRQPKEVLALTDEHGIYRLIPHSSHQWMAATILLATILVSAVSYWHHAHEPDMSHLDIAILTDDLPMEIFVD